MCDLYFQTLRFETQKKVNDKFEGSKNVENRHTWKILHEGFARPKFSSFEGSYFSQKHWAIGI